MNRPMLNRVVAAVAVGAFAVLPVAIAAPAQAATPTVAVTSPSYDAPGATVMTIITVTNVPAGYTATMSARVGSWATSCESFKWAHGPGVAVSQKCYANLPTRAGTWTMIGTATLTRKGAPTLVYRGSKTVKTQGVVTAPVSAAVRALITKCYNTTPNVLLTFDDGYTSAANLNSILATLKAYNVRGRFYLLGTWARSRPAMVTQIRRAGHYVENHTNTHPALSGVSNAVVDSQIRYGQAANTNPRLLRPPYGAGSYTARLYYLAQARGYRLCHWGSDTADWSGVSAATIVNKVVRGDAATAPARPGDSVLMHLTNTQTRYALPTLIRALRAKGLVLDRLR